MACRRPHVAAGARLAARVGARLLVPARRDGACGRRFEGRFGDLPAGYDHKYVFSHARLQLQGHRHAGGARRHAARQARWLPRRAARERRPPATRRSRRSRTGSSLPRALPGADPSWFGFPFTLREGGADRAGGCRSSCSSAGSTRGSCSPATSSASPASRAASTASRVARERRPDHRGVALGRLLARPDRRDARLDRRVGRRVPARDLAADQDDERRRGARPRGRRPRCSRRAASRRWTRPAAFGSRAAVTRRRVADDHARPGALEVARRSRAARARGDHAGAAMS